MNKLVFGSIAALGLAAGIALATASPAAAWTCQQRAQVCQNGGGVGCADPARMKTCEATHLYTAPSGNTWSANGVACTKQKHPECPS